MSIPNHISWVSILEIPILNNLLFTAFNTNIFINATQIKVPLLVNSKSTFFYTYLIFFRVNK